GQWRGRCGPCVRRSAYPAGLPGCPHLPARRPSCPSPRPRPATWPGSRKITACTSERRTWSRSAPSPRACSPPTTWWGGCTDGGDEGGAPEPPQRPYQWPSGDANELGAWYVTTEITTRGDGPLAGRRVAVKDNIAVAGLPMMNGSRAVEGFVPRRDATVVTRLLDAGATIAGKAVCEDLCFSGGSHTSRTGPLRNPWDRSRTAGGSSSGSAALV